MSYNRKHMPARFATPDEIRHWDELVIANPDGGNVFSSYEYMEQKLLTGYHRHYVIADSIAVSVLEKKTPPLGALWYLPKGPNVRTTSQLLKVLREITPLAKRRGVFAIRIEAELPREIGPSLVKKGLVKAVPIIPNPSTITLDISSDLDEILLNSPQKGRHAIRRAERDGVVIQAVPSSDTHCRKMYSLLQETAEGQFGIRSYDYYKSFWQRFEKAGLGQLFFAFVDGKVVAGAYAMVFGSKSTYKDGASIRRRTVYGASHLLQWKVIEWAKSKGATLHDFCGSPPSDHIDDPSNPHYGIGQFKKAFNRTVTDYIGCYDLMLKPLSYKAWGKIGERVYRGLYYRRTKDYYY
jgi:lipid II:glycine glycyltransferase (peptidoglycan interpeptide bridge formation enzyme)